MSLVIERITINDTNKKKPPDPGKFVIECLNVGSEDSPCVSNFLTSLCIVNNELLKDTRQNLAADLRKNGIVVVTKPIFKDLAETLQKLLNTKLSHLGNGKCQNCKTRLLYRIISQ